MRLRIDRDGVSTIVDVNLEEWDLIQDGVALEDVLGEKRYAKFQKNGVMSARVTRAMLYVRLLPLFPGLDITDFHFDLSSLEDGESETEGAVLEMPMQVVGSDTEETVTLGG